MKETSGLLIFACCAFAMSAGVLGLSASMGAFDTPGIPGDEVAAKSACVLHGGADQWVARRERIDVRCVNGVEVNGLARKRDTSIPYVKEKK